MADLAVTVPTLENQGLVTVVAMMFMVAFGVKAAVFPLFFWLPAAYHTPAFSTSAVFAGLLSWVHIEIVHFCSAAIRTSYNSDLDMSSHHFEDCLPDKKRRG